MTSPLNERFMRIVSEFIQHGNAGPAVNGSRPFGPGFRFPP